MLIDDSIVAHGLSSEYGKFGVSEKRKKRKPARIFTSSSLREGAKEFIKQSYLNSEILKAFRARHGVRKIEVEFVDNHPSTQKELPDGEDSDESESESDNE